MHVANYRIQVRATGQVVGYQRAPSEAAAIECWIAKNHNHLTFAMLVAVP